MFVQTQNRDDVWECSRIDERLFWAVDIGSGSNKLCVVGCDKRRVADVQCDARQLPFKDDAFVVSVLRHTLEHLGEAWARALDEAERVSDFVFVFHPRLKSWREDRSHPPHFSLPRRYVYLRSFKFSDLLFFSTLTKSGRR